MRKPRVAAGEEVHDLVDPIDVQIPVGKIPCQLSSAFGVRGLLRERRLFRVTEDPGKALPAEDRPPERDGMVEGGCIHPARPQERLQEVHGGVRRVELDKGGLDERGAH